MGIIFNKNILQEVYFGKSKELQRIEKQLGTFRNKYMDSYVFNTHVNSDKDLLKLNRMFEDFFGFGTFSLAITNQPIVNAYTLPIDFRFDVQTPNNLLVNKNTFKFNKDADYCCLVYLYSGVIFNPHYTDEEVMAFIMHEIGHNFFGCINSKNTPLVNIYKAILLLVVFYGNLGLLISQNNSIRKFITDLNIKLREKDSIITNLVDYYKQINDLYSTIQGAAFTILNFLSFNTLKFAIALFNKLIDLYRTSGNPISIAISLFMFPANYRNERLADNFATMYGYGDALSSALRKSSDHGYSPSKIINAFHKIPFVSTLYNLNGLVPTLIITGIDEHPQQIARCKDQLDLLNREAAKENIDPKMRKVILADIKAIEAELDKYTDISRGIEDPDLAKHLYNKFLYKYTGSKAIKDMLLDDRNKFQEYDKVFDRYVE